MVKLLVGVNSYLIMLHVMSVIKLNQVEVLEPSGVKANGTI